MSLAMMMSALSWHIPYRHMSRTCRSRCNFCRSKATPACQMRTYVSKKRSAAALQLPVPPLDPGERSALPLAPGACTAQPSASACALHFALPSAHDI